MVNMNYLKRWAFVTGGGMNFRFNMCGEVKYYDPPRKFEAGTLNLEGIFGLNAAINYLRNLGMIMFESTNRNSFLCNKN